LGLKYKTF